VWSRPAAQRSECTEPYAITAEATTHAGVSSMNRGVIRRCPHLSVIDCLEHFIARRSQDFVEVHVYTLIDRMHAHALLARSRLHFIVIYNESIEPWVQRRVWA
jgi:hypothetical protein